MPTNSDKPIVVLLVEDEALVRMLGDDILTDAGFRVIEAVTADEALTIIEVRADVQALVTDVEMPGTLNGFALARLVHKAWPQVGVVVTSGRQRPQKGDMPPGARFISKPYLATTLVKAVQAVLQAASEPITIPVQDAPEAKPSAPVLPAAVPLALTPSSDGLTGGLAEPLPEPPEE